MTTSRRKTLAGLNAGPDDAAAAALPMPAPPTPVPPDRAQTRPTPVSKTRSSERPDSASTDLRTSELRTSEVGTPGVPKYLQLERKDVLLWPRQMHELTVLRRVLNRRRGKGQGERLTENTLVRVAVDYLLANGGNLQGTTEEELRQSLGLPVRL